MVKPAPAVDSAHAPKRANLADAFEQVPPYRVKTHVMGAEMVDRLLAYASTHESAFTSTGVSRDSEDVHFDETIRESRALRNFGDLRSELENRFETAMREAQHSIGLSGVRWSHLELQLVAHGDGARFLTHIDTMVGDPASASYRALSGVYYFHREPRGFSGGALRLHPIAGGSGDRYVDISPENDSFVSFLSWAPHEVRPVCCPSGEWLDSRFAINCWLWAKR